MDRPDAALLERYRALLRVQARQLQLDPRLLCRCDLSDLVQETFLRALKGLDGFRGAREAELVKWLQQILAHVAVDRLRAERAQKCDFAREQSIHAVISESSALWCADLAHKGATPAREAEKRELLLRLASALEELPDDQRDAILMRDLSGASMAEIAERLERSEKAVAGLLLRGRRRLRELLPEQL